MDTGREQKALAVHLVNDEMRVLVAECDWVDSDGVDSDKWEFLCECGACHEHVALSAGEYDRRVADEELILAPGHLFAEAGEARQMGRRLRNESEALQAQARQAVRRAGITARKTRTF